MKQVVTMYEGPALWLRLKSCGGGGAQLELGMDSREFALSGLRKDVFYLTPEILSALADEATTLMAAIRRSEEAVETE